MRFQFVALLLFSLLCTPMFGQKKPKVKVNMKKPEAVALAFTKYFAELDMDRAEQLGTEDTKKFTALMKTLLEMLSEEEKKKTLAEAKTKAKTLKKATCQVSGDEATCEVCCGETGEKNEPMTLKRIEGKWYVHMSKEGLEDGGDGTDMPIIEEPRQVEPGGN